MENKSLRNHSHSAFSVIGYPSEIGVKNVQGGLGAREGPSRFLTYFRKLNGKRPLLDSMQEISLPEQDSDNLGLHHQNFEMETKRLAQDLQLREGDRALIAIGGGHDNAYPWFSGIRKAFTSDVKVGCLNIDAHFDLRNFEPVMTSGSPFRRLIDEQLLNGDHLVEFGIQSHCNAPELWEYALKQNISVMPFEYLRNGQALTVFKDCLQSLKQKVDVVVISLDLDALSYAYCPGVSAPQAEGFTASEMFQILEHAGSDKKVASLGVFELSPALDLHDLTSRFAAQAVWHFLDAKLSLKSDG